MKKCDILYICGTLDYGHSVSGNYILYYLFSKLEKKYDINYIGLWENQQIQKYNSENFIYFEHSLKQKTNEELDSIIPEHKILFLAGDDLTNSQLEYLHKKFNNKVVVCAMTSWVFGCTSSYPELDNDLRGDIAQNRYETYKKINAHITHVSSYSQKIQYKSFFHSLSSSIVPLPFDQIQSSTPLNNRTSTNKIILWGTTQPQTRRKGLKEFSEILNIFKEKYPNADNLEIHTVGPVPHLNSPFKVVNKGTLDRKSMAYAYREVDVFALTTLADSGPMMAAESIKNNTPLVSFNTNVSMDITLNGINGYTVDSNEDFADKLYKILFQSDFQINHDFIKKFNSEEVVLNKYNELFDNFLKK